MEPDSLSFLTLITELKWHSPCQGSPYGGNPWTGGSVFCPPQFIIIMHTNYHFACQLSTDPTKPGDLKESFDIGAFDDKKFVSNL